MLIAGSEDDGDALGIQPPGREYQRACRCPVQPVGVVDKTHERTILGQLSQQRQDRHADEKAIIRPGTPQS